MELAVVPSQTTIISTPITCSNFRSKSVNTTFLLSVNVEVTDIFIILEECFGIHLVLLKLFLTTCILVTKDLEMCLKIIFQKHNKWFLVIMITIEKEQVGIVSHGIGCCLDPQEG